MYHKSALICIIGDTVMIRGNNGRCKIYRTLTIEKLLEQRVDKSCEISVFRHTPYSRTDQQVKVDGRTNVKMDMVEVRALIRKYRSYRDWVSKVRFTENHRNYHNYWGWLMSSYTYDELMVKLTECNCP